MNADVPSDPYLMTAYDRKSVALTHSAPNQIMVNLQLNIDGTSHWVDRRNVTIERSTAPHFDFAKQVRRNLSVD